MIIRVVDGLAVQTGRYHLLFLREEPIHFLHHFNGSRLVLETVDLLWQGQHPGHDHGRVLESIDQLVYELLVGVCVLGGLEVS